jgi:peptidoglycan/LPS O-acetylase OafA/YrhL
MCARRPGIWNNLFRTHLRIDALFTGVTLGYFYHFQPETFAKLSSRVQLWIVGLLLLTPGFVFGQSVFTGTVGFPFKYLGFACILIGVVNHRFSRRGPARALAWIGFYSYSIYLWNPVLAAAIFGSVRPTPFVYAIYLLVCIGVGVGMAALVEIPVLRVRNKYFPDPHGLKRFHTRPTLSRTLHAVQA